MCADNGDVGRSKKQSGQKIRFLFIEFLKSLELSKRVLMNWFRIKMPDGQIIRRE